MSRTRRGPDLEVLQLVDRLRRADLGVAAVLRQPVEQPAVDLLGGLPGPVGVGADDPHLRPLAQRARQRLPALVRLPGAHRGQPRVGGVALRDAVPDDPDLRDVPVALGPRSPG